MNLHNGKSFITEILSRGRYSFTLSEAVEVMGKQGQTLNMALQRLKRQRWIVPFSRGFYLAMDIQHQSVGMLDPHWFVDDWARFLGADYYVGGLSAAVLHGAAHQRPAVFQVFMNKNVRPVTRSGVRFEVFYRKTIPETLVEQRKSPAGYFRASGPELTAYDILAYRKCCPSLNHAATVFAELGEAVDPHRLVDLLRMGGRISVLQRLGWLLEQTGWENKTERLYFSMKKRPCTWRKFDSRLPSAQTKDSRWRVIVNADLHPDIES